MTNDPILGIEYAQEALRLARKLNFKRGIATNHYYTGAAYFYQSEFDSALVHYDLSIAIFKDLGDLTMTGNNYNNMARVFSGRGDEKQSLEYNLKALELYREDGYNLGVGIAYSMLGTSYRNIANSTKDSSYYSKAIEHFKLGREIYEQEQNPYGLASATGNLALVYLEQGRHEDAKKQLLVCYNLFKELDDRSSMVECCINLGQVCTLMDQTEEAFKHLNDGITIATGVGDNIGLSNIYYNLGEAMSSIGNHSQAIDNFIKSLTLNGNSVRGPRYRRMKP